MRVATIVLIVLAICLIAYNVTKINFEAPLSGDSSTAVIGIVASLCAILLLVIFSISKKIQEKINK